jgi:hypothetical protein
MKKNPAPENTSGWVSSNSSLGQPSYCDGADMPVCSDGNMIIYVLMIFLFFIFYFFSFFFFCFFFLFFSFSIFIRYLAHLHFQCYTKSPSYPPQLPHPPTPPFWPWRSPVLGHIKFACPMGLSFQWWPTRPSFDTYAAKVKSSGVLVSS